MGATADWKPTAIEQLADNPRNQPTLTYNPHDGNISIKLLEPCADEPGFFLANICVPLSRTYWDSFKNELHDYGYSHHSLWMDSPTEDWEPLPSPKAVEKDESRELFNEMINRFQRCNQANQTVYGSGKPGIYKNQIETNRDRGPAPVISVWRGLD